MADSTGAVDVFLGDGTGKLLTPLTRFEVGGPVVGIVWADFNGDKKPDLTVLVSSAANSLTAVFLVTLLHQ